MTEAAAASPQPDREAVQLARVAEVRRANAADRRAAQAAEARARALRVSVAKALADGVSATELAKILGVSRQRVYQMRDELTMSAPVPARSRNGGAGRRQRRTAG